MKDAISELMEVLKSVGATMTLYGKPVTEEALRDHVEQNVDAFLDQCTERLLWRQVIIGPQPQWSPYA